MVTLRHGTQGRPLPRCKVGELPWLAGSWAWRSESVSREEQRALPATPGLGISWCRFCGASKAEPVIQQLRAVGSVGRGLRGPLQTPPAALSREEELVSGRCFRGGGRRVSGAARGRSLAPAPEPQRGKQRERASGAGVQRLEGECRAGDRRSWSVFFHHCSVDGASAGRFRTIGPRAWF